MKTSLAGRFALYCTCVMVLVSLPVAWLSHVVEPWWLGWTGALILAVPLLWIGIARITAPVVSTLSALRDGADSLKDNDFSVSIANNSNDELTSLVDAHNELGSSLREERQTLFQRELLLDTVIQSADIALVLSNANGYIVYSNMAARELFNERRPINGFSFQALVKKLPEDFLLAIEGGKDGLFTLDSDEPQTYHLTQNSFTLNAQPHRLFLFKHMTQELGRQEVAIWKNVIRVISHELNNSLAPISSLAHSGTKLLEKGNGEAQLETIFSTIEDRSSHLKQFIESYAQFARLPAPRLSAIDWPEFIERLQAAIPFTLDDPVPESPVQADPAQFEQVMINLIKNAHESGSAVDGIRVTVRQMSDHLQFLISDEGGGIPEDVMRSALLPFYSTKKTGTGLGLPLCREIVEAHGGRFSLTNIEDVGLQVRVMLPNR